MQALPLKKHPLWHFSGHIKVLLLEITAFTFNNKYCTSQIFSQQKYYEVLLMLPAGEMRLWGVWWKKNDNLSPHFCKAKIHACIIHRANLTEKHLELWSHQQSTQSTKCTPLQRMSHSLCHVANSWGTISFSNSLAFTNWKCLYDTDQRDRSL